MALTKLRGDYSSLTILSITLSLLLPISTAMSELLPAVDRHVDWRTELGRGRCRSASMVWSWLRCPLSKAPGLMQRKTNHLRKNCISHTTTRACTLRVGILTGISANFISGCGRER